MLVTDPDGSGFSCFFVCSLGGPAHASVVRLLYSVEAVLSPRMERLVALCPHTKRKTRGGGQGAWSCACVGSIVLSSVIVARNFVPVQDVFFFFSASDVM